MGRARSQRGEDCLVHALDRPVRTRRLHTGRRATHGSSHRLAREANPHPETADAEGGGPERRAHVLQLRLDTSRHRRRGLIEEIRWGGAASSGGGGVRSS